MSSADGITLVRESDWDEFQVISTRKGNQPRLMHICEVNRVKVIVYSNHHFSRADLKAWVDVPATRSQIELMLKIPAPTSDDVDRINPSAGVAPAETHSVLTDTVNLNDVSRTGDPSSGIGGESAHVLGLADYSGNVSNDPSISKETV